MNRRPVPPTIATPPTTFLVGEHKIVVTKAVEYRWTAAVDGTPVEGVFDTQADAWEAGVRLAAKMDAALKQPGA